MNLKNLATFLKSRRVNQAKPAKPAATATLSLDERIRILYINRILVMILCVILVSYGVLLDAWFFTAGVILFSVGFWMASLFAISNLQAILEKGIVKVLFNKHAN